MPLIPQQTEALRAVADAIIEAVSAAGDHGAPGGVIYAGLQMLGCGLAQYNSIMALLVRAGRLERRGELYFVAKTAAAA